MGTHSSLRYTETMTRLTNPARRALLLTCILSSACASTTSTSSATQTPATSAPLTQGSTPGEVVLSADLLVRPLSGNVLLHVSWKEVEGWGRVGSNGLVVLGEREALLVDTAFTDEQTAQLLDHVETAHGRRVTHILVTHSHDDRMGGIREAQRRGITVHGLALTAERAIAEGNPPPDETFASETTLNVDGARALAFFPGAAHAPDNAVVWLPDAEVLFGGCMIREAAGTNVGNMGDASLSTWEDAVNTIRARVPSPRIVVPGHGEVGDAGLLDHTIALVRAAR